MSGREEIAKRVITPAEGGVVEKLDMSRPSYWRADGTWYLYLPGVGVGNLAGHEVTEHEDGTITASPSILVSDGGKRRRHGYLRRGVWEPCADDRAPLTPTDSTEPSDA